MNESVSIVPTVPSHYDRILPVFDESFLPKFRPVLRKGDSGASFSHDFGLVRRESGGREFVALERELL